MKSREENEALIASNLARLRRLEEGWQDPALQRRADEWAAEAAARRADVRAYVEGEVRRRSGLPDPDMVAITAPRPTEAIAAARVFKDSEARMLALCGPRGTGKSMGLMWLVAQIPGAKFLRLADVLAASDFDTGWWSMVQGVRSWPSMSGMAPAFMLRHTAGSSGSSTLAGSPASRPPSPPTSRWPAGRPPTASPREGRSTGC